MRRTTTGAALVIALLAGPAVATAEAQAPVTAPTATVQAAQGQTQAQENNEDNGDWGLWGLTGLLGLLGLIPRRQKSHNTDTHRGPGGVGR